MQAIQTESVSKKSSHCIDVICKRCLCVKISRSTSSCLTSNRLTSNRTFVLSRSRQACLARQSLRCTHLATYARDRTDDYDRNEHLHRDNPCYHQSLCGWQVLDNEICFKWSEYENIYELFHARACMHRRVYTHRYLTAVSMFCQQLYRSAVNKPNKTAMYSALLRALLTLLLQSCISLNRSPTHPPTYPSTLLAFVRHCCKVKQKLSS